MSTPEQLSPFSAFKLDDLLYTLAVDTGVTIVDREVVASQLASMARIVAEGHVRDVPEHWTMAELAMKLITSRIGSSEVQVAIAQAACLRAHVTQALATAEAARVAGLEQQAEDKLNIDDTIERAKVALDEATAAIDAIPAPAKKSFVATLAPEFAHLAGEMEEGDGKHPPKPSFSGVPRDVVGFCCTGCKTYNLVRAGGNEWYSVYVGNAVGVFHGSRRAQAATSGVSHSSLKGFHTVEEATEVFAKAHIAHKVNIVPPPVVL